MTPRGATLRRGCGLGLLAAGLALAVDGGAGLWRASAENRAVAALMAGHDATGPDTPAVQAARARLLITRRNLDGAQAIADRLAATGDDRTRAALLYALGNAHMHHALDIFSALPFRMVAPVIGVAKAEYRQALTLDPEDWDARYNYAVAASLVRDTESSQPTAGDEMSHERAAWPDIPGAPNGMP